ncbi:unnamed protein product [Rhizophagus irregularis]|nr:unnamed protein product [Rhizophagus irregularis]CAB4438174.1 unnamed protein product [Rhizophagus irregularis]
MEKIGLKCNAWETVKQCGKYNLNYQQEILLDQLRIDIGKDNANNIGKRFVSDLTKSIWYVDICSYKTLDDRYKIPALFTKFFDRAHPERYKKSRSFNSEELQNHYKILINYIELPWMEKPKFAWLKEPLLLYATNLLKYAEYLINQRAITAENQNSLTPIVDEGKAGYIGKYMEET